MQYISTLTKRLFVILFTLFLVTFQVKRNILENSWAKRKT